MYFHKQARLIYLAHARTASSSTANALLSVGFKRYPGRRHHDGIPEGDFGAYSTIATVRSAWDTAVSWIFFRCWGPGKAWAESGEDWSLETFRRELGPINDYIRSGRMWWFLPVNHVLRFEHLEHDLGEALRAYGVKVPQLPTINVSEGRCGRHYSEFYTDETQEWVGRMFAGEIEALGQEFQLAQVSKPSKVA